MRHWGWVELPPHGLVKAGPIVRVILQTSPVLVERGLVPDRRIDGVPMMIDTGAQSTLVDDRLLSGDLGLTPVRTRSIIGVSGKADERPVYLLGVTLPMSAKPRTDGFDQAVTYIAEIVGMPALPDDAAHRGLLGRDFLRGFQFVYTGPSGSFTWRTGGTSCQGKS